MAVIDEQTSALTTSVRASAGGPVPWWRAYLLLMSAAFRSQLQYRGDLLITVAGGVAFQGVGLAFVWLIVERFGAIGGWSMADIAFLYGMRLVAHALWLLPCGQLFGIDKILRTGEFDRYLIRPAGSLTQLFTRRVHLAQVGDLLTGVVILCAAASRLQLDWSLLFALYLVSALVGGAMVEGALLLAAAAVSFRALSTQSLRILIDNIFNNFGGYPLTIFPKAAQFALTFVIPMAFVAYLPASVLLNGTDGLPVSPILAYAAPLMGPVLLSLAYLLWRSQMRHYSSSGT
ncbi:ABC transporter permease [Streptomyces sp. NPDC020965]|uniref:ABC transporter permease n=1 Tax=Streptomyces sp. NPDC020965 TaxID=3365105 RepID=UPI0037993B12